MQEEGAGQAQISVLDMLEASMALQRDIPILPSSSFQLPWPPAARRGGEPWECGAFSQPTAQNGAESRGSAAVPKAALRPLWSPAASGGSYSFSRGRDCVHG